MAKTEVTTHTEMQSPNDTVDATSLVDTKVITPTDTKVISLIDEEVNALDNTNVTSPTSTKTSLHTDEGFPRVPCNRTLLTRYVDHVTLRL